VFTGLIADLGEITALQRSGDGVRLTIASTLAGELSEGDSIAVNGVCLTAIEIDGDGFSAEVMNETLHLSSLAEARRGSRVGCRTGSAATSSRATSTPPARS
jgi:riboflavin synthase